jgi:hypothetical protein
MDDVIDGLKKSYIIISTIIWRGRRAGGIRAIAFGFGIMKGSGLEFTVRFICGRELPLLNQFTNLMNKLPRRKLRSIDLANVARSY